MDSQIFNELLKNADIVDIISRYIDVSKQGRNYKALCPFHNDKNPSLMISKDKQIFKCFVCGEGGNVFNFVQKYEQIPDSSAWKYFGPSFGCINCNCHMILLPVFR